MAKTSVRHPVDKRVSPQRPGKSPDPIRYHDVLLALSEARAAVFILDDLTTGHLALLRESSRTEEREVGNWLSGWILQVLQRCLDEAEAAFRKEHGTKKAVA